MYQRIGHLLRQKLVRNVITLYAVQACTYVLPVVTFPYLSRVLHPEGWGAVLFAQTIGMIIAIAVEYGFDYSAVRETARYSTDRDRLRTLVAGVLGAKFTLAFAAVLIALAIRPFTLKVAPSPALFYASVTWGVAQGINMLWYFQGLQRMTWSGGLDVAGKLIATLSIFVFVHNPSDGWKVMAAQALGAFFAHAITLGTAYREVGFLWPTPANIWEALRLGWPMFLFKASQTLMTSANSLILGFFSSAAAVGLFGGADKIRQIATQALWPITQALFPHQAQNVKENPRAGLRTVRRSLLLIGGASVVCGVIVAIAAPLIIRIALGSRFLPVVPALRIFGLIIPLTALAGILCFQWMLPLGFDREFTRVVFLAGLINVVSGIILVPHMGVTGMAAAVTGAEFFAVLAFDFSLRRKKMSPLGKISPSFGAEPVWMDVKPASAETTV